MAAFWDVLWTDARAAMTHVAPMLVLSLPTSAIGALFGARTQGVVSWGQLRRIIGTAALGGIGAALFLSMILQFSFAAEGLPLAFGRGSFSDQGLLQLILVSPATAFVGAFVMARWNTISAVHPPRRRYTLRQLFVAQVIVGLLLGWWTYTRCTEIGQRKLELGWQSREQSLNAIFAPYGWFVKTWHDKDDIALWEDANPHPKVVTDATLALVARQRNIVDVRIKSDVVTNDGLQWLATAKGIKIVEIVSNQVTDEGIHAVCQIPGLETLIVDSPHVTLNGLKQLPRSNSLECVQVRRLTVTEREYSELMAARPGVFWGIESKE